METLEQKLKQFKHAKAVGDGYPAGYKESINAYMEGFNSGRFNAYLNDDFVEIRKYANEIVNEMHKQVKEDWKSARLTAVAEILKAEENIRRNKLLYGKTLKNKKIDALIVVMTFICDSLPVLKED